MSTSEKAADKSDRAARSKKPKTPPKIVVKESWCKGCALCVEYCNRGVLEMDGVLPKVVDLERCNWCLLCEVMCPDFAIEVRDPNDPDLEAAEGETP